MVNWDAGGATCRLGSYRWCCSPIIHIAVLAGRWFVLARYSVHWSQRVRLWPLLFVILNFSGAHLDLAIFHRHCSLTFPLFWLEDGLVNFSACPSVLVGSKLFLVVLRLSCIKLYHRVCVIRPCRQYNPRSPNDRLLFICILIGTFRRSLLGLGWRFSGSLLVLLMLYWNCLLLILLR